MQMNWKRRIAYAALLYLSLMVIGSCVSKKEYLLKVDEGKRLSMTLEELKSKHYILQKEKEALDKQVIVLQGERSDLEKTRDQLQLQKELP